MTGRVTHMEMYRGRITEASFAFHPPVEGKELEILVESVVDIASNDELTFHAMRGDDGYVVIRIEDKE